MDDNTVVYPLPVSLPMGLPDSVLIGQSVHEHVAEPAVDLLFGEGDLPRRHLLDTEVAASIIVDDLNAFVITDEERVPVAAASLDAAMDQADTRSASAGLPAKASKTEFAASTGRKVAGVNVDGDTAGGPQFTIDFFYGHAQFSAKTYNQIVAACPLEARAAGGAALASSGSASA